MTTTRMALLPGELDLSLIRPSRGDKFSPNLYAWLNAPRRRHRSPRTRVYRDTEGTLWIGMFFRGDLVGSKLYGVLCNGSAEPTACWSTLRGPVEITDFWERYAAIGRCAIDTKHTQNFIGDDKRWSATQDGQGHHGEQRQRTCLWCGRFSQTLVRWTETVERQEWLQTPPAAGEAGEAGQPKNSNA